VIALRGGALSGVFVVPTFVVFVGYGLGAARVRSHVIARPRVLTWMRRAFVALGAKLALVERLARPARTHRSRRGLRPVLTMRLQFIPHARRREAPSRRMLPA
jgi:hypothetical protein